MALLAISTCKTNLPFFQVSDKSDWMKGHFHQFRRWRMDLETFG
jgi:hypothetical protein